MIMPNITVTHNRTGYTTTKWVAPYMVDIVREYAALVNYTVVCNCCKDATDLDRNGWCIECKSDQ